MGYAGGTKKSPTYRAMGDHTETIEVDFDPKVITYKELLKLFWKNHNPCGKSWSRQYMSAVFYNNDTQKKQAQESKDELSKELKRTVTTPILKATTFWRAEDYHQKYRVRNNGAVTKVFKEVYPKPRDFTDSTIVTRANGFFGGYTDWKDMKKAVDESDLKDAQKKKILDALSKYRR